MPVWLLLVGAVTMEVIGTTALKLSDGFTRLWPSVIVVAGYGLLVAVNPLHPHRQIGLAGVSYRYPNAPTDALQQIDLDLPVGSALGIVGTTGAGKTTLVDLPAAEYQANTQPMLSHIDVGTGEDISILELARLVAEVTGFEGRIVTDPSRPDGTPRKLLDVSRLASMGWRARVGLREGIEATYRWYLDNPEVIRG
jgi:hypothetical protein